MFIRVYPWFDVTQRHQATKRYKDREKNARKSGEFFVSLWLGVRKISRSHALVNREHSLDCKVLLNDLITELGHVARRHQASPIQDQEAVGYLAGKG